MDVSSAGRSGGDPNDQCSTVTTVPVDRPFFLQPSRLFCRSIRSGGGGQTARTWASGLVCDRRDPSLEFPLRCMRSVRGCVLCVARVE